MARPHTERPLYKMSVQLIDTYKLINKVYYERKARRKVSHETSNSWDDENYDYVVHADDQFGEHYLIKERIGKGSFGQVVRAHDLRQRADVAIKIIKSKKPFALQARTEIELLLALRAADRDDKHNVVRLLDHFVYRGHQCLVFEMLSYNLYELLKNTQFHGVSLNLVRKFAKQILHALAFLARPEVGIIHCDLKPENILLRHPKRSAIKVIDFGSSCRSDRRMYSYIQSRFYRSPEVMLGLPYTVAIDVWSLGCILVEMHTGEPLFSGADQLDQMKKLVEVLGMPPDSMIAASEKSCREQYFEEDDGRWQLRQPAKEDGEPAEEPQHTGIAGIVGLGSGGPGGRRKNEAGHSDHNYDLFLNLVQKMLHYDPTQRIKPAEALQHSFLNDSVWAATHASLSMTSAATNGTQPPVAAKRTTPASPAPATTVPAATTATTVPASPATTATTTDAAAAVASDSVMAASTPPPAPARVPHYSLRSQSAPGASREQPTEMSPELSSVSPPSPAGEEHQRREEEEVFQRRQQQPPAPPAAATTTTDFPPAAPPAAAT